jgi:Uma2 family endonuclease
METVLLDVSPWGVLTDEQLLKLCAANRNLKFERNAKGELIVMALTGGTTGRRNMRLAGQLDAWTLTSKLGEAFDSSTAFHLPNGAVRPPDAAWISNERWQALTSKEQSGFVPLAPDFVVELRSESDRLQSLQDKMQEWMQNGCRMAWLIDPQEEKTYIYRTNAEVEVINGFDAVLSGEDVLPEFAFALSLLK